MIDYIFANNYHFGLINLFNKIIINTICLFYSTTYLLN